MWKIVLLVIVLLYLIILLLVYVYQAKLIFHPTKLAADYHFELHDHATEVFFETEDGERINAIRFTKNAGQVILYFHGNAGVLDTWQNTNANFDNLAVDLLVIDYRGYGKSTGTPGEEGLYKDADAAYKYLLRSGYNKDSIIVYGRSLGSGVASWLVAKYGCKKLILETPYTSMADISQSIYPYFFPRYTLRHRFSNMRYMDKITGRILLLHGLRDDLIPVEHSRKLFAAAGSNATLVIIEQGEHNNLPSFAEYKNALREFVK